MPGFAYPSPACNQGDGSAQAGHAPHLGGVTLTPLQSCIVLEELGWGSIDWMVSFGAGALPFTFAATIGYEWVITGQKAARVTNATVATHALAMLGARDGSGEEPGFGIAFIPLDLPGITRGKPLDKIGQRALNQGELFFDEVRIPADQRALGRWGYRCIWTPTGYKAVPMGRGQ